MYSDFELQGVTQETLDSITYQSVSQRIQVRKSILYMYSLILNDGEVFRII